MHTCLLLFFSLALPERKRRQYEAEREGARRDLGTGSSPASARDPLGRRGFRRNSRWGIPSLAVDRVPRQIREGGTCLLRGSAGWGTCELALGGHGGAGQVEYRGREARAKASKGVRALRAWRRVGCPRSRWPDVGAKEWGFLCKIMGD